MNYFPTQIMLTRLALGLGLLLLPLATAHAAYQEDYVIPMGNSSSASSVLSATIEEPSIQTETEQEVEIMPILYSSEPTHALSRIEFTHMVIDALYPKEHRELCLWDIAPSTPPRFTLIFTDVRTDDYYALSACIAMRDGIVNGYRDGSFHPDEPVTFSDAATILSRAFILAPYADVDAKTAAVNHTRALLVRNAVPTTVTRMNQTVTASTAREMLERLQQGITWRPAQSEAVLFRAPRTTSSASTTQTSDADFEASVTAQSSSAPQPPSSATAQPVSSEAVVPSSKSFWQW